MTIRILAVAGGVAFYSLLALFPAIAAFVSLYGLFADSATVNNQLSMANGILPSGAVDVVRDQVNRVVQNNSAKLGFGFIVGFLLALWSANAGMKALIDALNVVYDEKEKRGIVKLNLMSLAFTLTGMASLLLAFGAVVAVPVVLNFIGLAGMSGSIFRMARWPVLLGLSIVGLAVMYRYAPSRREPRWQWISVGSLFAAIVWLIASVLFSWYVANFGSYNATYGSLGAAIGMMTWMWISAVIILLGAQINAEIEHQTAKDSTVGADKPLGARGAVMADTVGAAQTLSRLSFVAILGRDDPSPACGEASPRAWPGGGVEAPDEGLFSIACTCGHPSPQPSPACGRGGHIRSRCRRARGPAARAPG